MKSLPISSAEARARFKNRQSVSSTSTAPIIRCTPDAVLASTRQSVSSTSTTPIIRCTPDAVLASARQSVSSTSTTPIIRCTPDAVLASTRQSTAAQQFKVPENLLRILGESSRPASPSSNREDCCAVESICYHTDTCSACSESTAISIDSNEEEANKNIPGFGWASNKKARKKSNETILKIEKKKEKSAEGLKDFVYSLSIMDFYEMQKKGCNEKCQHGRECLKKVSIEYIGELRERFWGRRTDKALKPNERRAKIQNIFATAIGMKKNGVSWSFHFIII